MAFWNLATLQLEQFRPGIMSKAEIGNDLIMVCMQIDPEREIQDTNIPLTSAVLCSRAKSRCL